MIAVTAGLKKPHTPRYGYENPSNFIFNSTRFPQSELKNVLYIKCDFWVNNRNTSTKLDSSWHCTMYILLASSLMQLLTQRSPLYICISILLNKDVFLIQSGYRFVVRSIATTAIILIYSITLLVCTTLILFKTIFSHESCIWMLIIHYKTDNLSLNN